MGEKIEEMEKELKELKLGREKEEKRNDGIKRDIGKREMEEGIKVLEKWWDDEERKKGKEHPN